MPRALQNNSVDELGRRTVPPVHTVEYAREAEQRLDIERAKRLKKSGQKSKGAISTSDLVASFATDELDEDTGDGVEVIMTMNAEQIAEVSVSTHAEMDDFLNATCDNIATEMVEEGGTTTPAISGFDELDILLKETKGG